MILGPVEEPSDPARSGFSAGSAEFEEVVGTQEFGKTRIQIFRLVTL
jgi:hypothetical protein